MGSTEATVDWSGGPPGGKVRYQGRYDLGSKSLTDLMETVRGLSPSLEGYQFIKELLQTMRPKKSLTPVWLVEDPTITMRSVRITPAASALAGHRFTYVRNPYSWGYGANPGPSPFGNIPPPLLASAAQYRHYGMGSNYPAGRGFSLPLDPNLDYSHDDGKPGTNPPRGSGPEPEGMR